MNKPLRILVQVSQDAPPDAMQMSDCVQELRAIEESPIDGFDASVRTIAKLAAQMPTEGEHATVAEMLTVAAVASTEAYFRDMLSRLAAVCPLVGERLKEEPITFGAARSYPPHMLALASLERTLFSSRNKVAEELSKYVGWEPKKDANLKAAIDAYERACACRHSIVHWRGALDSATMRELGLNDLNTRRYGLAADFVLVQRVLAACSHLVHAVNNAVFNLTLQRWVSRSYLTLDEALMSEEVGRCEQLLGVFRSTTDSPSVDGEAVWKMLQDEAS